MQLGLIGLGRIGANMARRLRRFDVEVTALNRRADFLREDQQLEPIEPVVADSGEGCWTALEAIEQGIRHR